MESSCFQLDDLPDEILLIIFKKMNNIPLLYFSLFNMNKRFNQVLHDSIFASDLNLFNRWSDDSVYQLADSILNRFCSEILPQIHNKIKCLNLESSSMKRILLCTNYPDLKELGLYNLERGNSERLFSDESLLFHKFKNQILSLVIHMSHSDNSSSIRNSTTILFTYILNMFINLQYLNFAPCSVFCQQLSFNISLSSISSPNLLELHVNVSNFNDCLYLLDGRLKQLRKLVVNISIINRIEMNNQEKLPNLRCFIIHCDLVGNYDELVIPLLYRMVNLEELSLNLITVLRKTFVDGINLMDITNHMKELKKFTLNICSTIDLDDQIDLPSREITEETFRNFKFNKIICSVDYFRDISQGQCHIYTYPYRLKIYDNITNNFPGGLFQSVRRISLHDEQPFEHEFFLQITQSFPLIERLSLINYKPQKNKQSKNEYSHSSIIKYPNLKYLDLCEVHQDYIKQFLIDTKTCLPYYVTLIAEYDLLDRVTYNFTRDQTRVNCSKVDCVYFDDACSLPKHFNNYFFKTYGLT